jgi:undecaprenyl diphosphate synthase
VIQSSLTHSERASGTSSEPPVPRPVVDPIARGVRGLHVGIIMDGNGRWARRRGLPRTAGHRAGTPAVRRIVAAAPRHGIAVLTLYAFSSDNWRRPPLEVAHLMRLFRAHLRSESDRCVEEGVRVSIIGRRDRLPAKLVFEIEGVEGRTRAGQTLHLQIAIDYSSRDAILRAAEAAVVAAAEGGPALSRETFPHLVARALNAAEPIPDVDLVIRTGGESRLSDFLLWESAYAELVFTPCLWPDFEEAHLADAMKQFHGRERRFGALPEPRAHLARKG